MLCRISAELDTDGSAITRRLLQLATACCFIYLTRVPSFDLPAEEGPHRGGAGHADNMFSEEPVMHVGLSGRR